MTYKFGPDFDFNIKTTGEMREVNGDYENMNDTGKLFLQCLCHVIHQIKGDLSSEETGVIFFKGIFLIKIGGLITVNTREWRVMLNVKETGHYSYEIEFFSPEEFRNYGNDLLNFAYTHVKNMGGCNNVQFCISVI